jgi:hypothetical protein
MNMRTTSLRLPLLSRLLTLVAFVVWSVLPAVCGALCLAKACCKPTISSLANPKSICPVCSHCLPNNTRGLTSQPKPIESCCKWMATRSAPVGTLKQGLITAEIPVLLATSHFVIPDEQWVEARTYLTYPGIPPPKPIAFFPLDRGPPIG